MKGFGDEEGKSKGEKEGKTKFEKILRFWQFQTVFDYYNTILHYSGHIYTIFILNGVENQMVDNK